MKNDSEKRILEYRKNVSVPSRCPYCGQPLTKDESAVEYIVPFKAGGTLEFDSKRYVCKSCQTQRVALYRSLYQAIIDAERMRGNRSHSANHEYIVNTVVNSLVEQEWKTSKNENVVRTPRKGKDRPQLEQLRSPTNGCKYDRRADAPPLMVAEDCFEYNVMPSSSDGSIESIDYILDTIEELEEAYEGQDLSEEQTMVLNGNSFSFREGFPIDKYIAQLSTIGNKRKGNAWRVEMNDEGLVLIR